MTTPCLVITEYYWHMKHYVKQITLLHFQQKNTSVRGRRTDQGQRNLKHSSWKAFQCRQIFSRFLNETALVLVRETLFYYCTVCFEKRHHTMTRQGTDQKQMATMEDTSEQMELGKCCPCLWTKFCMWTSLCLFPVCCILGVCTRSMTARKICLFTRLVRKNSCFSEVSQNISPLVNTTKSHRILCSVTAQVCEQSLLAQCSYPCLLLLTAFMGVGKKRPCLSSLWRFVSGHLGAMDAKGVKGFRDLHR